MGMNVPVMNPINTFTSIANPLKDALVLRSDVKKKIMVHDEKTEGTIRAMA